MPETMTTGEGATFENIVIRLRDGTTKILEPTGSQEVIILSQNSDVKDENGNDSFILAHASDDFTASMILRLIQNAPTIIPHIVAGILSFTNKRTPDRIKEGGN